MFVFAHVITTHLSPSSLMFHPFLSAPSLLFPHGRPDWTAVSDVLSDASRPKIAGQVNSNKCEDEFGYMAKYRHFTGSEPKQSDKMVTADDDATLINDPEQDSISDSSKTTHDKTGWFGVPTVCETSVSPIFRFDHDLQKESKESLPGPGKPRANRGCWWTETVL